MFLKIMKPNALFFVALLQLAKNAQADGNATNLVHLLHQNMTDTCMALDKISAMECNCDPLASSSGFACQCTNDSDTEQVVEECGEAWMPSQIQCAMKSFDGHFVCQ